MSQKYYFSNPLYILKISNINRLLEIEFQSFNHRAYIARNYISTDIKKYLNSD